MKQNDSLADGSIGPAALRPEQVKEFAPIVTDWLRGESFEPGGFRSHSNSNMLTHPARGQASPRRCTGGQAARGRGWSGHASVRTPMRCATRVHQLQSISLKR